MTTNDVRDELIEYLRKELLGPAPGFPVVQINGEEILRSQDPPRLRYSAGVLFPTRSEVTRQSDIDEKEMRDADTGHTDDVSTDEIGDRGDVSDLASPVDQQPETDLDLNLANQYLPSAMGVSTLVKVPRQIHIRVQAARYEKTELSGLGRAQAKGWQTASVWFRKPFIASISLDNSELVGKSVISFERSILIENADSKLAVHVISRPYKNEIDDQNVRLITFTLINRNECPSGSNDKLCFFQCRMEIASSNSEDCFLVYPDLRQTGDPEERTLRFLYRKRRVFGVGHGCSCDWQEDLSGRCTLIWTEVLPVYEVRPIEHVDLPEISFSMVKLAEEGSEAISLCEKLANAYRAWIEEQRSKLSDPLEVPPPFRDVAQANLVQCENCLARILGGIELLRNQPRVRKAFALANKGMYLQQAHYELASNKVRSWIWKDSKLQLTERYKEPDYSGKAAAWRPFQLAFLLMNLQSIANTASKERNIVDLIWFPTGGGKTEAYLGLSAFSILLRRLSNPRDGGTTVLMRYTLRLLTAQQFQRAASLICACEFLRRSAPEKLGGCPISIGLWVGGEVTPNDHQEAVSALNRLYQSPNENKFIVLACPWCGAAMGPVKAGSNWKVTGYLKASKPSRVLFRCEDSDCPFSTEAGLPLAVVDEAIYKEPPTLVIGTVDKFAMLAWRPEAKSLFGLSHNYSPPRINHPG
jgi:hypothetical protein